MDQGNESILELTFKMTGNGSEMKERFVWARANEPRASVWSARSLLPLFEVEQ